MKRLLALCVAALAIAGCGGDAKSAATTVPLAVPTSVADTTAPSTTSEPSSTSTTAVLETTTLPATTTTVATEDLIKKAVQDYFTGYWTCGQMPSACDPTSFTAVRGKSRSTIQELSSGFVAGGLYFSSDLRGSYLVAESIVTNAPTEVVTGTCWYDAAIVLGPKGPDGQATVINDEILSIRYDLTLFLENGQWRVGAQLEKQQLGNGNLCPPAS